MGLEVASRESPFLLLIVFFLLLLTFFAYKSNSPVLSRKWNWVLRAFRILAFLTVIVTLVRPVVGYVHKPRPQVGILLDVSESMLLPPPSGAEPDRDTRLWRARDALKKVIKAGSGRVVPRVYFFGGDAAQVTNFEKAKVESVNIVPGRTSIGKAMEKLSKDMWNASSFVLLSDGVDNGDVDPLDAARKVGVPIHVWNPGKEGRLADVEVSEVRSSPKAFLGSKVEVLSSIRALGLHGREAAVSVTEGSRVISSKKIVLPAELREEEVRFEITPQEPGTHFFQVEIPKIEGEFVTVNNKRAFAIDVQKESTRLLYCEGKLSWDFTFLKRNLEREKGLSTVFLVLEKDGRWRCYGERPVMTFPGNSDELKQFDVLILGDLPREELLRHEEKIIDFLKEGKGVLVLGGREPSGVQRFQDTKLLDVLPVILRKGELNFPEEFVSPKLTEKGKLHPVTSVGESLEETENLWEDLPPLVSPAGSVFPKEGADVLVEGQVHGFPLIIAGRYGLGRVIVINAHSIWRWDLLAKDLLGTNVVFTRLVSNGVQWLSEREAGKKLNIRPEREIYGKGEEVSFSGWLKDATYQPIVDAAIKVYLDEKIVGLEPGEEAGYYYGKAGSSPGRHSYEVIAMKDGEELARDRGEFLVEETGAEMRRLGTGEDVLRRIAEVTGGRFFESGDTENLAVEIAKSARLSLERHEFDAWRSPFPLLLLLVFLGVEWSLRRRFGLP